MASFPTRTALFWCIAIVAGTFDVWLLIGWREINPLNLAWLSGDPAQYEAGWEFLRHETTWRIPVTWISRLDYPSGVSASYLDIIPLAGVLLRPFSSLLPENFQYLGLYAVLCYILQAYYGLRLTSLVAAGDDIVTVLGAGFFLLSPILVLRLYGHFPHSTHWILVACLYHYFRWSAAECSLHRYMLPFVVLSMIAAAITPYIALMAVVLGFAGLWRAYLQVQQTGGHHDAAVDERVNSASVPPPASAYALWGAALIAATLLSLLFFGFIVPGGSQFAGEGYARYSLNILSPLNPNSGGLLLKSVPMMDPDQAFEGYNYLGIGVLALLFISIARRPALLRELWSPSVRPLTIASIFLTVLALSVRVTLGDQVLFTIPTPKFVFNLLAAFRSSGRLFWPVYYALIFAALAGFTVTVPSARARRALLAAALVLQYFDTMPLREGVAAAALAPHPSPLKSSEWSALNGHYRHLAILPALQCGQAISPGGLAAWPYFARLVARSDMTLNSAYLGRISPQTLVVDCVSLPDSMLQQGLQRDTAYILSDIMIARLLDRQQSSAYCRRVDGFNLCTRDAVRWRASGRLEDLIVPYYRLGTEFRAQAAGQEFFLLEDIDTNPGWGRWTTERTAAIYFRLPQSASGDLRLDLDLSNVNVSPSYDRQRVVLRLNDRPIARLVFRLGMGYSRSVLMPADLLRRGRLNELRFDLPDAIAPSDIGINRDGRPLALAIHRLEISAAGEKGVQQ